MTTGFRKVRSHQRDYEKSPIRPADLRHLRWVWRQGGYDAHFAAGKGAANTAPNSSFAIGIVADACFSFLTFA
jgi:hypothetical protein